VQLIVYNGSEAPFPTKGQLQMGTMIFQLPANLSAEMGRELERACIIGGPDNMPWPTQVKLNASQLSVSRDVDESGCLLVPWEINGAGRLMTSTATLMERAAPYLFQVELARGKINQLRSQAADWRAGGLQMPAELNQRIGETSIAFGRAATQGTSDQALQQAQQVLSQGYLTSDELVRVYIEQVFQVRHQRQPKFETILSCRLGESVPPGSVAEELRAACTGVYLPTSWKSIQPNEGEYCWDAPDALLAWAEKQQLDMVAGPLIDFSPNRLPGWLRSWERDLHGIAGFMGDYVQKVVGRYHERIRCWQLTTASNCAAVLSLSEDELLWLTVKLADAARQIDSGLELIIGIAQPWGEYMATAEHTHSPFIFADTLIRAGLNLAAVDLEWIMGIAPAGSYCRDLLEASRLLDLYALLGVPLQVTLGYPASADPDPKADPALRVGGGHWHNGFSPQVQAEWGKAFTALSLCKPYVRGISWVHLSDAEPHQNPQAGLVDAAGAPRPVLAQLRKLREQHLA
jgi:hypothetical protein